MPFFGGGGGGAGDYVITGTNIDGGTGAMPAIIGDNNMALGNGAMAGALNTDRSIAIGNGALPNLSDSADNIAIGYNAAAFAESGFSDYGNIVIGNNTLGAATFGGNGVYENVIIGRNALETFPGEVFQSVILGAGAGIAGAVANVDGAVIIGQNANVNTAGGGAVAVGAQCDAGASSSVIGYQANGSDESVIVGALAQAGLKGIALGKSAVAGADGIAIGYNVNAGTGVIIGSIIKSGQVFTTDQKALDLSATWNNAGVTFTGWKFNVTDTASKADSLLADWQVGGVSKFKIDKTGKIYTNAIEADISTPLLIRNNNANGDIYFEPGNGVSSGDTGGFFTVQMGNSVNAAGAALALWGGYTSGSFQASLISIEAGYSSSVGGTGGNLLLASGSADGGGTAGNVYMRGGYSSGANRAGHVYITGGEAQASTGNGGEVIIGGGPSAGGVDGGVKIVKSDTTSLNLQSNDTGLGFFAATPVAKPTVSGSRGGNPALQSLLTAMASLGLITDSTT